MDDNNKKYSTVLSNRLGYNYYVRDLLKEDYTNYLSLYDKQEIHENVEIETSDEFTSYYIANSEGNIICCKAIAPYTHVELNIANNETLFLYQNNSIKIKNKKYTLNDFSNDHPTLCVLLVFVIPLVIVCLLGYFLIDERIAFVLYFVYFLIMMISGGSKARHLRKLEKMRDEFLCAYYKGKYDSE